MMDTFTADESVAWPSYVDFLSTFAILMVLFAGYMAFLLSNGVRDTEFIADIRKAPKDPGVRVDMNSRKVLVNLSDLIQFNEGCPKKPGCPQLDGAKIERLQSVAAVVGRYYPHAKHISVQGRADQKAGSNPYVNMEVAGGRALEIFKVLDRCERCSVLFRHKLRIANVGDKEAIGVGPEFRTVFLVLDYSEQ